jgi:hypothetical protein
MNRFIRKHWNIFRMGLLVLRVRVMMRFLALPRLLSILEPRNLQLQQRGEIEDLLYYIDRWLQLFPYNVKGNCFPRSLSLYWIARRAGYPVSFHCGIRKEGGALDGHAWLVLDNRPFHEVGRNWQLFTMTFSYPSVQALDAREKTVS